jgi:hypothetical protein
MQRSNEWGESLDQTIARSRAQQSLLAYSMVEGEQIEVGFQGRTPEGIQLEEKRLLVARSLGLSTGALEVIEDTAEFENWAGRTLCLGSYAFQALGVEFTRPGLLRGLIGLRQGVVIDLSAQHFVGQAPDYLLAEYDSLTLEDETIF